MEMPEKQLTFYEQVAAAVASGDRQRVTELYREHRPTRNAYRGYREMLSSEILEASIVAAKKNPGTFQREVLVEILAMQAMLLHRVGESIQVAIQEHDQLDGGGLPWGWLPPAVADEMLPRYGKIASEVAGTIKLLQRLESPSKGEPNAAAAV